MAKECGKILIEMRAVPNFEAVRKTLKIKTGVDPTPKEIADHIDGMRKNNQFLPIAYQKIVSMALVYNTPNYEQLKETEKNVKPWSVVCFVGDESSIIRNFWLRYEQIKNGFGLHPIFVTCDRKRGTIPLIVNRSFSLIKAIAMKMVDKYKMLPEEILEKGNTEENPGFKFCIPYKHIKPAMKDMLTKADKWENNRPNYMNTYSNYTTDLASDFSLSGVEDTDIKAVEKLVLDGDWDILSKKTVESALNNWKNFAVTRYINFDEMFIKEAVAEDYLNDPELAEYFVSKPQANPYDIVITEFKPEEKEVKPIKATVLIRKPTKPEKFPDKVIQQVEPKEDFPPKQKYIEFEENL